MKVFESDSGMTYVWILNDFTVCLLYMHGPGPILGLKFLSIFHSIINIEDPFDFIFGSYTSY